MKRKSIGGLTAKNCKLFSGRHKRWDSGTASSTNVIFLRKPRETVPKYGRNRNADNSYSVPRQHGTFLERSNGGIRNDDCGNIEC